MLVVTCHFFYDVALFSEKIILNLRKPINIKLLDAPSK